MSRKIVIDSGLLALLVVGKVDKSLIAVYKRVSPYTSEDYDLLVKILSRAPGVLVAFFEAMRLLTTKLIEENIESLHSMKRGEFVRLGLTDCTLLDLNSKSSILLTADLDLYLASKALGYEVRNFNHLRDAHCVR